MQYGASLEPLVVRIIVALPPRGRDAATLGGAGWLGFTYGAEAHALSKALCLGLCMIYSYTNLSQTRKG